MSFWKTVAAVAIGVLIAGAILWTVLELRARSELAELNRQMSIELAKAQAEEARSMQNVRRTLASSLASVTRRDRVELLRLPAPSRDAKPGDLACSAGFVVRRVDNGWTDTARPSTARPECEVRK